jgi:hypothetical protein
MPVGLHALQMHITRAAQIVDFLTYYDYNTNKYELCQGKNQTDLFRTYSAGSSKGPVRPLGGVRGVPATSTLVPPLAAREKKDLKSYIIYFV